MEQQDFNKHKEESFSLFPMGKEMQIRNGVLGISVNGVLRNTKYIGLEYYEADGIVYKNDKPTKIKLN